MLKLLSKDYCLSTMEKFRKIVVMLLEAGLCNRVNINFKIRDIKAFLISNAYFQPSLNVA